MVVLVVVLVVQAEVWVGQVVLEEASTLEETPGVVEQMEGSRATCQPCSMETTPKVTNSCVNSRS